MVSDKSREGNYSKVALLVNDWLDIHVGETFDLDLICRQLSITERENRKYAAIELARQVSRARLEKNNKIYRYIDTNYNYIDIVSANPDDIIKLNWVKDTSGNDFNLSHSKIYPKSTITLAGEKDNSKTAFCLNFLKENMDSHQCVYHTNEMSGEELVARMRNFKEVNWYKEDGTPKFLALERFSNWHDVVRQYPDAIHIIDYLDPGENAFMIGTFIDQIRQKLGRGIALIAIQKRQSTSTKKDGTTYRNYVDYGIGGQFSEHRARIVIHLHNKNELYVKSCKSWIGKNPTGRKYKFDLINGAQFTNIREIAGVEEDYSDVYRGGD